MSHTVSHKSPLAITDKRWLIPNRLSIFKRAGANRGQKNWYCQVYISGDHRPIRSLKTTDEAVAEQEAREQAALEEAATPEAVDALAVRCLGRKGAVTRFLRSISDLPAQQRPEAGRAANRVKKELEAAIRQAFGNI